MAPRLLKIRLTILGCAVAIVATLAVFHPFEPRLRSNEPFTDQKNHQLYSMILSKWDFREGWAVGADASDVSAAEVIDFLAFYGEQYGVNSYQLVKQTIVDAFSDDRSADSGAFLQRGEESYARTSFFLFKLSSAVSTYPELAHDLPWLKERTYESAHWLADQRKDWIGNQSIFALLAFKGLDDAFDTLALQDYAASLRSEVLDAFVYEGSGGYWPEAPSHWSNRLLVPYLQISLMGAGLYHLKYRDPEMSSRLRALIRFLSEKVDENGWQLDVTESYDYHLRYEPQGIQDVPVVAPSIFWFSCLLERTYCEAISSETNISTMYRNMIENFENDSFETLMTDSYIRWGVITSIEAELHP